MTISQLILWAVTTFISSVIGAYIGEWLYDKIRARRSEK